MEDIPIELLPANWAINNWFVRNRPIRFFDKNNLLRHRPFLVGFLNDLHPRKVAMKARQVGLTECALIEMCWLISIMDIPIKIVYAFPRGRQASEFSKTRFDPAVASCPVLSERTKEISAGLKQFYIPTGGLSFVEIKSTWEEEFGESTDADIVYFDEYDRMKRDILPAFEESLKASQLGWRRYISTPTLPEFGVSAEYELSDKRKWFIKCEHCGEWQHLTYENNIIQTKGSDNLLDLIMAGEITVIERGTFMVVCSKCHKPLTRTEKGCWVAENPSVTEVRGYHFSQLMAPWITADDIVLAIQKYRLKSVWYNYVLGLPYKEGGATLTIKSSGMQPQSGRGKFEHISVGIDWGKVNWAVVVGKNSGQPIQVISAFYTHDTKEPLGGVKELAERIAFYDPDIIIADAGWGADRLELLKQKFGKKVWGCMYIRRILKTFNPEWIEPLGIVKIPKVALIKYLKQLLEQGDLLNLSEDSPQGKMVLKHIQNVAILETETEEGIEEDVVRLGEDHLAHCLAYASLGLTRRSAVGKAKVSVIPLRV